MPGANKDQRLGGKAQLGLNAKQGWHNKPDQTPKPVQRTKIGKKASVAIVAVVLFLFAFFATFIILSRLNALEEPKIAGKAVAQSIRDMPSECSSEANPFAAKDHSNFVFYTIVDTAQEVRGYLFGITKNRWGRVENLPQDLQDALQNSSKIVGDLNRAPVNWYAGMAQGSPYSLGQLLGSADQTGLARRFEACRLGGFWRDMHAGYAMDLVRFCDGHGVARVEEQAHIGRMCGLDEDLKRFVLNEPIDYRPIEEPSDRMQSFETADLTELRSVLTKMMLEEDAPVTDWPVFSMAEAEAMVERFREEHPILYRLQIEARNRIWFKRMRNYMRGNAVPFFALTVSHLPGPDGILSLFENAGYRVIASPL